MMKTRCLIVKKKGNFKQDSNKELQDTVLHASWTSFEGNSRETGLKTIHRKQN